jgi:hypothetical protein
MKEAFLDQIWVVFQGWMESLFWGAKVVFNSLTISDKSLHFDRL